LTARKKIDSTEDAPSSTSSLVQRMSGRGVTTAGGASRDWMYIDFLDPRTGNTCLALEWLFGSRGLLAGRILQLRAKYSKGKSSFMYFMYSAAQRGLKAFCQHIETEGAMAPPDFIASFGCDPEELLVAENSSLEECFDGIDRLVAEVRGGFGGQKGATGKWNKTKFTDPMDAAMEHPIVIGVDSFSALGLEDTVNEDIADMSGTPALALHSRKIRDYLRRRQQRFKQTRTLVMIASHETAAIKTGPAAFGGGGSQKSSLAQEAIGIHATYVLDVSASPWKNKDTGEQIGDIVTLSTNKNKISPKNRTVRLYLRWNHGFDIATTDTEFLLSHQASPLAKLTRRHSKGISCQPLGEESFKSGAEFVAAVHANKELVSALRETLRIRGYGFDFETKYSIDGYGDELDGAPGEPAEPDTDSDE